MGIGALVFLGCPFRMLQRLGGGDGNALLGLLGFVVGVQVGVRFEARGYSAQKTSPSPPAVGLVAPSIFGVFLALALGGSLLGPVPGASGERPDRAPLLASLAVAAAVGAALSATGFCSVLAARQVLRRSRLMLIAALLIVAGYLLVQVVSGRWAPGFSGQPVAHSDGLWNAISMALVGLCGVLAGGCPVRQVVLAGEGHGDALVTCAGLVVGGSIAHSLGLASSAAGPTDAGKRAVALGIAWCLAYAVAATPWARRGRADA
jgi:hypothetical protein